MASSQEPIDVPRPKKSVTFGLILLAIIMPWFALYLDGASWPTVAINFAAWLFLPPVGTLGAIVHAIICLCRTDKHRKHSKPARRRLRYDNHYSANAKVQTEEKAVEPEPKPALVTRAVTEPPPAPVMRAVTEGPTPVERAPTEPPALLQKAATEPPAKNPSATSSSTSVLSSDVEKENAPAPAPPQRTATASPQKTATAPPLRATTAKEDDPFKDPEA